MLSPFSEICFQTQIPVDCILLKQSNLTCYPFQASQRFTCNTIVRHQRAELPMSQQLKFTLLPKSASRCQHHKTSYFRFTSF